MAILGKTAKIHPKVVPPKSYLRITRERNLELLHGCKPKLCFPFATRVEVQSIMETFLTPQSLKHTIYGKKCIYQRYWHEHIFGSLRNKNMSKHFWSRPIVGAFKHALWLDCLRTLVSLVLAYERVCNEAVWHACSQGKSI